ncbi:hypothetical protein TNCV_1695701 [Trichonephila clavipes]|nr:hypothetical protein TNCV_1695701 [Trichonephila clavipes]
MPAFKITRQVGNPDFVCFVHSELATTSFHAANTVAIIHVVVVTNAICLTKLDRDRARNSSWLRARIFTPVLSTIQVTVRFCSVPPQFRGRKPWVWPEASQLSSPSPNLTRGLPARRRFRVLPFRKSTIHLQTSMSS